MSESDFAVLNLLFFDIAGALCVGLLIIAWLLYRHINKTKRKIAALDREIQTNPFFYPYCSIQLDVSGARGPIITDYIDRYLSVSGNRARLMRHNEKIQRWKYDQETYLLTCPVAFKDLRLRQFRQTVDDAHAYHFQTIRYKTRYSQLDYVRYPYTVKEMGETLEVSYEWIQKRDEALRKIGYEATLREYHAKNQRRLMTPTLRKKIAERDDFTCQICGRWMPDWVGLQIDHIIPVSKGGKTVESNLQVLCSKCNGSKSDKLSW